MILSAFMKNMLFAEACYGLEIWTKIIEFDGEQSYCPKVFQNSFFQLSVSKFTVFGDFPPFFAPLSSKNEKKMKKSGSVTLFLIKFQ